MSPTDAFTTVAGELKSAYGTRTPIEPPRNTIPGLDVAGAYRIQRVQEEAFIAEGHKVTGRKIGLTSLAMQQQLGVDSPDFGFFLDTMMYPAGASIPVDTFISPKVEPELGFQLGADLHPGASIDDVAAAVKHTFLAVEIIDSRVRDWDITLVDTIADNASCGAIILSTDPVAINPNDLPSVTASMSLNNQEVGKGTGAAVMGHPLAPIAWLATILGEQGVSLKKDDIILSGSFCAAAPVIAGQSLSVDYGELGSLSVSFV
ncbi:MAG: fumarylacetoacetate hydrolase family protein [Corynebacterium sp.]|uniref:2-keto-4-pentenoate hydratase n=1 Tax=Corynebacterium sp. TaxID=1720 RepID=UPI0026DB15DD|nr:fumarylacetoacetate hydrolase family protein [Corynebacterium sp.]MDO4761619.1 fumarylacetoacetate hydrolase family protein [Corynebacterium sp.]